MAESLHRNIKKFYLIYERINKLPAYPSLKELKGYLNDNDFNVDERSIQRYLKTFREEFWIEIVYDKVRKGYFIDFDISRPDLDTFFHYLSSMYEASVLFGQIKDHPHTMKHLDFEHVGLLQGVSRLEELITVIKTRKVIKLSYRKYVEDTPGTYTFHPHLLKEYQGRWYVIGMVEEYNDYRIFGIDRITGIEKLKKTFSAKEQQNTSSLFYNIIGLNYSDSKVEEVVLQVTPLQAEYTKTLPLHHSQEVLSEDQYEVKVKLKIIPNFEFKQKLLMLGPNVKVLQPEWLAEEVKKDLEQTLALYGH